MHRFLDQKRVDYIPIKHLEKQTVNTSNLTHFRKLCLIRSRLIKIAKGVKFQ